MKIDGSDLVGLTKAGAISILEQRGSCYRIREEEGRSFSGTADNMPFRKNLFIKDDIVYKVELG